MPPAVAIDGKTLRGSFDAFHDRKAAHVLSAFAADGQIILGHLAIAEKSNEIPAAQAMIAALGLTGRLFTLDAMHCQKNIRAGLWDQRGEVAFYVSSAADFPATAWAAAIRGHWGIKNRNHYVRDVSRDEDKSRIRDTPGIMARARSFALNIMRKNAITTSRKPSGTALSASIISCPKRQSDQR